MRTVFSTEWFDVEEESFGNLASLGGRPHYRINSPDGVLILALTERNDVVLVRQFRPALRQYTLELPGGGIDAGETPAQAARRELHEETGYVCKTLADLGSGRMMTNRHACREFAFFGTSAVRDPEFQAKDDIEAMTVPLDALRSLVVSGHFEQLAALGLLLLVEWKLGHRLRA